MIMCNDGNDNIIIMIVMNMILMKCVNNDKWCNYY